MGKKTVTGKKSKRTSLSVKYKIQKKVKEHHRKLRKEVRKTKSLGITQKGTDKNVRLPNLFPHKKSIVDSLNRKKTSNSRGELMSTLQDKMMKSNNAEERDIESFMVEANNKETIFRDKPVQIDQDKDLKQMERKDHSKKAYQQELNKVIDNADVILEVLDVRDPMSCRSKELESQILSHKDQKKLILVLNKVDLVSIENATAWMKYLRREFPCVMFKANTQSQSGNLSSISLYNNSKISRADITSEILTSNKSIGMDNLLSLLKNYARVEDSKRSIMVGVVGFPNVGKSSLINSMTRAKSVGVSASPGFTKTMQEVILDKTIKLLDCPGVVFSKNDPDSLILKNVVRVEDLNEPIEIVEIILKKIDKQSLIEVYEVSDFNTCSEFLASVARKRGKLIKGGVPDYDKAARLVIKDWNDGKIKYFSVPPVVDDGSDAMIIG